MFANRKPGLLALIALLAVLGGYGHQLFGQFEHHHLAATDHHQSGDGHHHHDGHHHSPASAPDEAPGNEEDCDQCPCALIPALADTASLTLPALACVDTVPDTAQSAPGPDIRSIDYPPAA
jgi:hypothetical protein